MDQLYLESTNGKIPIDPNQIEKYNLEIGTRSPFTSNRIIGKYGEYYIDPENQEDIKSSDRVPYDGFHDDGIDSMDNGFEISTSEIIDFAQGADSD